MGQMTYSTPELSNPIWAADYLDREHLMPFGAKVDAAAFTANANGHKFVPSGTFVGRTIAERNAGTGFGIADVADDELYLLAFSIEDAAIDPSCELYRQNSVVKENFLPDWGTLSAPLKAKIQELYVCITGSN